MRAIFGCYLSSLFQEQEHQELGTLKESPVSFYPGFSKSRHSPLQLTAPEGSTEHLLHSGRKSFSPPCSIFRYNSRRPTTVTCHGEEESTRDHGCHQGLWNIRGIIRTMPRSFQRVDCAALLLLFQVIVLSSYSHFLVSCGSQWHHIHVAYGFHVSRNKPSLY